MAQDRGRPTLLRAIMMGVAALLSGTNKNPMARRAAQEQFLGHTRSRQRMPQAINLTKRRAYKKLKRREAKASRRRNRTNWRQP